MKAASMRCAPWPRAGRRSWTAGSRTRCAARCCKAPTEHGFGTELWTLKRVRALIERLYGVRFSQMQVWRMLGAMGFSSQKPERRAIERDEEAVLQRGSARPGPRSKKVCRRAAADRLHRRVGPVRASHPGAHLGAQGLHADHPVPLQLEARLGHRRADPHELPVPAARWRDQERADRRVPQGAARAPQAQAADHLGRRGAAQKPLVREYLDSTVGACRWRCCPATRRTSIRSSTCGPGSSATPWPTSAPTSLTELKDTARNKLKSAQHRPSIITACWKQAELW